MKTPLAVYIQVVRIYADAVRQAFGPLVHGDDGAAEIARLLLGLADSTADCADALSEAQQHLEALARELGVGPPPPKLRLIEGGLH